LGGSLTLVLSYEFWKKVAIDTVGVDSARENRQAIYLGASGIAEFFADIALCPLEATRIRLVSQPSFANGLAGGFARIAREEGVAGFYAGFGPILFKQVPYTMAKFAVFEVAQEKLIAATGKTKDQLVGSQLTGVNLAGGLIAGMAAAVVCPSSPLCLPSFANPFLDLATRRHLALQDQQDQG
jgi:solute carrier family 25 phosphate transporter 3